VNGPYAESAPGYRKAGYFPIPVSFAGGTKKPVLSGCTGYIDKLAR
jgi:hypothetical protein